MLMILIQLYRTGCRSVKVASQCTESDDGDMSTRECSEMGQITVCVLWDPTAVASLQKWFHEQEN